VRTGSVTLALAALCCACSSEPESLVVGGQDGPAGRVAAEALAQALEARGVPVVRRFESGGARAIHEALRAGQLDVAVEHTGQALEEFLDQPLVRDPDEAFAEATRAYRRLGLEVLPRLGWNDPWVVVVRGDVARSKDLRSLTQLGRFAVQLRAAIPGDFLSRRDGFPNLSSHYGLGFGTKLTVAPGTSADALAQRRADVGFTRASDPRIVQHDLVALEDELGWFPPWQAVPVARRQALRRQPAARAALRALAGRIPDDAFRRAAQEVALRKRPVAEVLRRWLPAAAPD